jgi:hypothetical protein
MGGLGSRLRVAVGALAWCRENGRSLIVFCSPAEPSEDAGKFPCRLSDLYEGDFREDSRALDAWTGKAKHATNLDEHGERNIRLRCDKLQPFAERLKDRRHGYRRAFESLKPTTALAGIVNGLVLPRPTVGVIVRYSLAHKECAEVGWYLNRLRELSKGRSLSIYLSCDDRYVFETFAKTSYCVRSLEKTYDYDRWGIMRQCADAHILAKCDWVLGANHSSFSQHVALIRGARYRKDSSSPEHVSCGRYEDKTVTPDQVEFAEVFK